MRKCKKTACFALVLALCVFMLTGCFEPEKDAAETIDILYRATVNRETGAAEEFGVPASKVEDILEASHSYNAELLKMDFEANGFYLSDETIREILEAREEMYSNLKCTCTISSESKKSVCVTISTQYYDEPAIAEKAAKKTLNKAFEENIMHMSEKQLQRKLGEYYADYLIKGYQKAKPEDGERTIYVSCTVQHSLWFPNDINEFAKVLGDAISGQ